MPCLVRTVLKGRPFWVKRDDLLQLALPGSSSPPHLKPQSAAHVDGNKARKFKELVKLLSWNQGSRVEVIGSYGGFQSNSMAALASIVAAENAARRDETSLVDGLLRHPPSLDLVYFTPKGIPGWLKQNPVGNFKTAIDNGTRVIELTGSMYEMLESAQKTTTWPTLLDGVVDINIDDTHMYTDTTVVQPAQSKLWVPQGGAAPFARIGVEDMVDEVVEDVLSMSLASVSGEHGGDDDPTDATPTRWVLAMASGTGTCALYAHRRCLEHTRRLQKVCLWSS